MSRPGLCLIFLLTYLCTFLSARAEDICLSSAEQVKLPAPYCDLESILPFQPHGWYSNAEQIENLFKGRKIKTVIEIGCWVGSSTRHMASLLPSGGKLYAVDHWLGSSEHQSMPDALATLYDQFLSNVIHAGLTNEIIPVRLSSLQAASFLKEEVVPDLIYIDAEHTTEAVYLDLMTWFPFVKGHGVLCGDDWGWFTVSDAVKQFAQENGLQIEASGNFWRLIEPKNP